MVIFALPLACTDKPLLPPLPFRHNTPGPLLQPGRHASTGLRISRGPGQNPADINGRTLSCWGCGSTKHLASDLDAPATCREHYRTKFRTQKDLSLKHAVYLLQEVVSQLEVDEQVPPQTAPLEALQSSLDPLHFQEDVDNSHSCATPNIADNIDAQIASNQLHAYMAGTSEEHRPHHDEHFFWGTTNCRLAVGAVLGGAHHIALPSLAISRPPQQKLKCEPSTPQVFPHGLLPRDRDFSLILALHSPSLASKKSDAFFTALVGAYSHCENLQDHIVWPT